MFLGINGSEFIVLGLLAVVLLGPEKLPEYAAKLAQLVRRLRELAEGAKGDLQDQLGDEFGDVNWRQFDPRQYDPRRIVREALQEPFDMVTSSVRGEPAAAGPADETTHHPPAPTSYDPARATPWDVDAT